MRVDPEDEVEVTSASQSLDEESYLVDDVNIKFDLARRQAEMMVSGRQKVE